MKIHSGRIDMKSQPGEGTEIILYFPVVEIIHQKKSIQTRHDPFLK